MLDATTTRSHWSTSPWWLVIAIVVVYAPSLGGGWLDYDDDWLVRDNELLNVRDAEVLLRIFGDFTRDTRLVLGAEFLPVRDLLTWFARAWLGLDAFGLRVSSLALYASACALLLRWASTLGREGYVLGVWLFALHPVHVESVAWIASLKDVLALFFVSAALLLAETRTPWRRAACIVCVTLGCGAKGMAAVAPALLALAEVLRGRPQDRVVLGVSALVCALWLVVHGWVGATVGMFATPLGEGAVERVLSVTVLFARYLALSFMLEPQSVVYDVTPHGLDVSGLLALTLLVALVTLALLALRRGVRWPAVLLAWFVVALLPVSQLLAPLQNRMADRYLFLAVWAPCAAAGIVLEVARTKVRPQVALALVFAVLLACALTSLGRALVFGDPVALFAEATERTRHDARAPLLLADTLFAREQYADAEFAYRLAFERDALRTDRGRRAGNGLGRLLAGSGRREEAIALYARLVERYPDDPRVLHNLAVLEEQAGALESAAAHRATLAERFPHYRSGAADRPGPL